MVGYGDMDITIFACLLTITLWCVCFYSKRKAFQLVHIKFSNKAIRTVSVGHVSFHNLWFSGQLILPLIVVSVFYIGRCLWYAVVSHPIIARIAPNEVSIYFLHHNNIYRDVNIIKRGSNNYLSYEDMLQIGTSMIEQTIFNSMNEIGGQFKLWFRKSWFPRFRQDVRTKPCREFYQKSKIKTASLPILGKTVPNNFENRTILKASENKQGFCKDSLLNIKLDKMLILSKFKNNNLLLVPMI